MNNSTLYNPSMNPLLYPDSPQITLTFNDVLGTFSDTFIFRMELLTFAFFGLVLYLQYYTKQLEKAKRWRSYVTKKLNIEPILQGDFKREDTLIFISDVLFLPVVAFVLIFIGYETGWWI